MTPEDAWAAMLPHYRFAVRYAASGGWVAEAEDRVHTAMLRCVATLQRRAEPPRSMRQYLITAVRNVALTERDRRHREPWEQDHTASVAMDERYEAAPITLDGETVRELLGYATEAHADMILSIALGETLHEARERTGATLDALKMRRQRARVSIQKGKAKREAERIGARVLKVTP